MRSFTRQGLFFILSFFFTCSLSRAELLTHPSTNVATEGWDGPGLGGVTINWFLGWPENNGCASTATGVSSDGGLSIAQVEAEVTQAMATWASVADIRFNKVGDSQAPGSGCFGAPDAEPFDCDGNPDTYQINIYWGSDDHCHPEGASAWWFDGPWNPSDFSSDSGFVFAHAWGPYDILGGWGDLYGGNVHLDDGEIWVNNNPSNIVDEFNTTETSARVDIQTEVLHELGHSLGLAHTNSPGAVMNPYKWNLLRRDLTQHDRDSILSIYRPARAHPGIVLLFDLSGSMNWSFNGDRNSVDGEQRLTLAKNAALPFLALLNTYGEDDVEFSITDFGSQGRQCVGTTQSGMVLASDAAIDQASTVTVPGLTASGGTPLLAGLQHAANLFGDHDRKAVVLLSDGYHNCPSSVQVGDQLVTDLVTQLSNDNILVYPIGFGRPEDFDSALLTRLASDTGGEFHPVTGPTFDPASWNPTTALQNTYKNILVDALGLEVLLDPLDVIEAGKTHEYDIQLTEYDSDISFMLSWATKNHKRLSLELVASDGQMVPTHSVNIERRTGDNFIIATVKKAYLKMPGKLGARPWLFRVSADGVNKGEVEHFQYSVLARSQIQFRPRIEVLSESSKQSLLLTASLVENGQLIAKHGEVDVEVVRPAQSMGNWLSGHAVSQTELAEAAAGQPERPLSDVALKAIALAQIKGIPAPTETEVDKLKLYDDGTHGDKRGGDGIYSNEFHHKEIPGNYEFVFSAKAVTKSGTPFTRESRKRFALNFVLSPAHTLVSTQLESGKVVFTVTPRDRHGNHLGPGFAESIIFTAESGMAEGDLIDNVDGSYSQTLQLPADTQRVPAITFTFDEVKMDVAASDIASEGNEQLVKWLLIVLFLLMVFLLWRQRRFNSISHS